MPIKDMNIENGEIGVYSIVIPSKNNEGELVSLSVGEWNHVASYDLYVTMEPKITAMGVTTDDLTIGSVRELEKIENEQEYELEEPAQTELESLEDYYRELYEDTQKKYNSLLLNLTRLQEDFVEIMGEYNSVKSELKKINLDYNSLLQNYTKLQENLEEANLELSVNQQELDLAKLELEQNNSELNKAYERITLFQITTFVAFISGFILTYIIPIRR
jgi:hypothetical protein